MKIIKTQKQLNRLKKVEAGEEVVIAAPLRLNDILEVFGVLKIQAALDCDRSRERYVLARNNSSVVAREQSSVVAREQSSVEARGQSSVVAWDKSSVVARDKSSVVARDKSSVVAWNNSSVVAWNNSSVEARGQSSVEAWGQSSVVAWEQALVRALSSVLTKLSLHGFSMLVVPFDLKVKFKKEKTCLVQKYKPLPYLQREGVPVNKGTVILYKRVSHDYKTQENTSNETLWQIGDIVTHPAWEPKDEEVGLGKFHACSKPYFCDEFRNGKNDRYVAISIATKDLYEWPGKQNYPHKIAFRKGRVIFECDKFGDVTRKS